MAGGVAVGVRGLDGRAVALGAAVALVIVVPAAVVGQRLSGEAGGEPTNAVFVFFGAVLTGFLVGGYLAARRAPAAPYINGALAALAAYLVVQGVGVVLRLVEGEAVSVVQIAFNGLVAYASGLVGGLVAARGGRRR